MKPAIDKLTKRTLLSAIMKIYDPMGILECVTVTMKLLFQDVWKSDLQWEELVPQ